jgi:hypothetical protein
MSKCEKTPEEQAVCPCNEAEAKREAKRLAHIAKHQEEEAALDERLMKERIEELRKKDPFIYN